MIKNKVIVSRYAEAFFAFCKDSIGIEAALKDLKNIKSLARDNAELGELLNAPEISFAEKARVIDEVLGAGYSGEVRHFLKLLIDKGRIGLLQDIIEYSRVKYSHLGQVDALIKTTFPADAALIKRLEAKLEEKFKRKFKFYIDLDSSLLGGAQVIIGNRIIDGSVRKRLDDFKQKLTSIRL